MQNIIVNNNCWYSIFLDAYRYSTSYLLFTISLIITSILLLWIYEKPRFYKLIFKRSKHSNNLSPAQSSEDFEVRNNRNLLDRDISNIHEEKKIPENERVFETCY